MTTTKRYELVITPRNRNHQIVLHGLGLTMLVYEWCRARRIGMPARIRRAIS